MLNHLAHQVLQRGLLADIKRVPFGAAIAALLAAGCGSENSLTRSFTVWNLKNDGDMLFGDGALHRYQW